MSPVITNLRDFVLNFADEVGADGDLGRMVLPAFALRAILLKPFLRENPFVGIVFFGQVRGVLVVLGGLVVPVTKLLQDNMIKALES
jgi:hypothetical protein